MGQDRFKAAMFLALWQANFIGEAFGAWMFNFQSKDGPIQWALMVTGWLGATHYVWNRVRVVFWPEDAGRF